MTAPAPEVRRARLLLTAVGVLIVCVVALGVLGARSLFSGDDAPAAAGSGPDARDTSTPGTYPTRTTPVVLPTMTPERAEKLVLDVPTGLKNGVSTGFPHTSRGAVSAAVHFWEEFAFVDDHKARQQLSAVGAADSTRFVDERISEVRTLREAAGLPPSGGTPAGITFSTAVNAACPRTLDDAGDVIQVWLNFDRYATKADGGSDDNPFRNEDTDLILRWENGSWRITDAPEYRGKRAFPAAYYPTSPFSWQDGWVQVRHGS